MIIKKQKTKYKKMMMTINNMNHFDFNESSSNINTNYTDIFKKKIHTNNTTRTQYIDIH